MDDAERLGPAAQIRAEFYDRWREEHDKVCPGPWPHRPNERCEWTPPPGAAGVSRS